MAVSVTIGTDNINEYVPDSVGLNVWNHYVFALDAGGNATVYVNGSRLFSGPTQGPAPRLLRARNYIGRSNYLSNALFGGAFSDFQFAEGATFSAADAMNLFHHRGCPAVASPPASPSIVGPAVGGAVGGAAGLALLCGTIVLLARRSHRSHRPVARSPPKLVVDPEAGAGPRDVAPAMAIGLINRADDGATPPPPPVPAGWQACVVDASELVVGAPLGAGGFAAVHAATWRGTAVAVKIWGPKVTSFTTSTTSTQRAANGGFGGNGVSSISSADPDFAREVAFLGRLRHPNLLAVYAVVLHPQTMLISATFSVWVSIQIVRSTHAISPSFQWSWARAAV